MDKILGTKFEQSLRLLLLLKNTEMTEDRLSGIDFITTYASDFGFDAPNLHGNGIYRLCEYPTRKTTINQAIKELVLKNLIVPVVTADGFVYRLTNAGKDMIQKCECSYSQKYEIISAAVQKHFSPMSDDELVSLIFKKVEATISEGDIQ